MTVDLWVCNVVGCMIYKICLFLGFFPPEFFCQPKYESSNCSHGLLWLVYGDL